METTVKKLYEAMFLVDSAQASDWDAVVKTIENILKRSGAEIVAIRNWADRKLAYEIDQKSRGTYVLCFFRTDGSTIYKIENDVQLSDKILRVLILSTEARDEKDIEKDMFGTPDEKQTAVEDKAKDIETQQKSDKKDDTVAPHGPEVDEGQQSADSDVSEAIETKTDEYKHADAMETRKTTEPESPEEIEKQTTEIEEDNREKDAAD